MEKDLEGYLRELAYRYRVRVIACDPWQMMSTAQRLRAAGLNVVEYPQTQQTTQMTCPVDAAMTAQPSAMSQRGMVSTSSESNFCARP